MSLRSDTTVGDCSIHVYAFRMRVACLPSMSACISPIWLALRVAVTAFRSCATDMLHGRVVPLPRISSSLSLSLSMLLFTVARKCRLWSDVFGLGLRLGLGCGFGLRPTHFDNRRNEWLVRRVFGVCLCSWFYRGWFPLAIKQLALDLSEMPIRHLHRR